MIRIVAPVLLACFPLMATAADWPQWMGPTRDGVWTESNVLDHFPAGGPKKLWETAAEGGYAGPAVAGGQVFIHDYIRKDGMVVNQSNVKPELSGDERVRCLDAQSGNELWKHLYPCKYCISYPCGPRCTPTVVDGRVYTLGAMGNLCCLETKSGKELWKKDLPKDYSAPVPTWGFASHPLVVGDLVVCMVGGPSGAVVAFDKITGKEKWKALAGSHAGYCPPTLTMVHGKPQLLIWHPKALVGMVPETGKSLWEVKLEPTYGMSVTAPQRHGDHLYAAGIGGHAVLLKFHENKVEPDEVWRGDKDTALYSTNSTPLIHKGVIFGCDSKLGELLAVELETGKRLWNTPAPTSGKEGDKHGTAFLVRNEDRFFLFSETGELIIAQLNAKKYHEVGRAKLLEPTGTAFGRSVVWSAPAFAHRCVFARNDKAIVCYDLSSEKK